MSWQPKPTINLTPLPNTTASVEDLISYLRSTFLSADFQNVANTLTQREQDINHRLNQASIDAEKWKNDYLSVEKKHGELLLKHLTIEEEYSRLKTENEAMKENVIALTEEKKVFVERDKRGEERYSKLLNEFKELDEKNKVLSCSKARAEVDNEKWRKKLSELEVRMSKLEDEASVFFCQNPVLKKKMEESGVCIGVQKEGTCPDSLNLACGNGAANRAEMAGGAENFCKITGSSLAGRKVTQSQLVIEIDSDDEEPVRDLSFSYMNVHTSDLKSDVEKINREFVNTEGAGQTNMKKAEDSFLASNSKRKLGDVVTSEQGCRDDDNTRTGKRKIKSLQELDNSPQATPVKSSLDMPHVGSNNTIADGISPPGFVRHCTEKSEVKLHSSVLSVSSDRSDSDDDSDQMDNLVSSIQRQQAKRGWEYEADMLRAFETDNELCLNAVCALYRQRNSNPASSNNQGFQVVDAIRGTALAKFLIDGDEQGNVRKSVSELQQSNPKGLDDCRKLAKRHSKQLFDIYQKKKDPLFLPPL